MSDLTNLETYIFKILVSGSRQKPVLLTHLAAMTGENERKIRDAMTDMRVNKKIPVISLDRGYWLGNKEELTEYYRREKHREETIRKNNNIFRKLFLDNGNSPQLELSL